MTREEKSRRTIIFFPGLRIFCTIKILINEEKKCVHFINYFPHSLYLFIIFFFSLILSDLNITCHGIFSLFPITIPNPSHFIYMCLLLILFNYKKKKLIRPSKPKQQFQSQLLCIITRHHSSSSSLSSCVFFNQNYPMELGEKK